MTKDIFLHSKVFRCGRRYFLELRIALLVRVFLQDTFLYLAAQLFDANEAGLLRATGA